MVQSDGPGDGGRPAPRAMPPERAWGWEVISDRVKASPRAFTFGAMIVIVGIALTLRLWGLNWDEGHHLHPDERFLSFVVNDVSVPNSPAEFLDSSTSSFSPYNNGFGSFVYGTLPIFTTKIAGEFANELEDKPVVSGFFNRLFGKDVIRTEVEVLEDGTTIERDIREDLTLDGYQGNLVGRALSALFDVGTVVMVFFVGRLLFNRWVALVAALLLATTVFHIQLSHFFAVDTFLTFFALVVMYFSIRISQGGGWWNFFLAGAFYGFALASKISALSLVLVILLAVLIRLWPVIREQAVELWPLLRPMLLPKGEPGSSLAAPAPSAGTGTTVAVTTASAPAAEANGTPLAAWAGAIAFVALGVIAAAGIWFGVALVTVIAVPLLALLVSFAFFGYFGPSPLVHKAAYAGIGLGLVLLGTFLVFRIAQPYAFDGPNFWDVGLSEQFKDDMRASLELQSGQDFPPNIQWVGRTSYVFPWINMVVFGMGPALGIAVWAGFLYGAWRALARRDGRPLLLLAWAGISFAFWGNRFNPSMRSFLPIYPSLILLGAVLLVDMWQVAPGAMRGLFRRLPQPERWRSAVPLLLKGTVATVVALTFLYALAFTNIYRNPVSRVEAGEWLDKRAPEGSVIASEHWDDGLPRLSGGYQLMELTPYQKDDQQKIDDLIDQLDRADYVTYTSNRVYGSVPQIPIQFPETIRYYDLMFAEELGFDLVAEFTSYPSLFGITIPDQSAEESFTVYDHPKVHIFEKNDEFSRELVSSQLSGARADAAVWLTPKEAETNALQFTPDDLETQRAGGTWSNLFDTDSIANRLPLWTWLFVVELVSFAALPLALLLFRGLPDRGYLLSKPLGFLGLGYIVWLGVSLKLFDFTRLSIALVLVLMLLVGGAVAYRTWDNIQAFVRQHWRSILFWEALFLGAFVAFYMIRLANPDLWHPARGGEKPMDFAYLNAVVRSTTLPPIDPWFSGGYINYYYFGQFLTGTLTKFTGIVPEVSYNLAVPLFFSLGVAATYSLVFNLAEATRRFIRRRPRGGRIGPTGPVLAGITGVFLVMVAGNLGGAKQLVDNFSAISPWHVASPDLGTTLGMIIAVIAILIGAAAAVLVALAVWGPVERFVGRGVAALPAVVVIGALVLAAVGITVGFLMGTAAGGTVGTLGGLKAMIFDGASLNLRTDWYWAPSRMMPGTNSITEFPFFSFLFADLHAHMMAIPFAITSLAVGGAVVLNATRLMKESEQFRRWAGWGLVVVLALVIGALRWINSWDYPTFLLMGMGAIVIAERVAEGQFNILMLARTALKSGVLVVLTILFFYPFQANYELPATGFQRMDAAGGGRETTPFHQYAAHFGVFLFLAGAFVAVLASRGMRRLGGIGFFWRLGLTFVGVTLAATIIVGVIGWVFDQAPIDFTVRGLSASDFLRDVVGGILEPLPGARPINASLDMEGTPHPTPVVAFALGGIATLGMLGWLVLRRVRSDGAVQLFVMGMLGLALILSAGVDVAILDPDIARQNTVFKFYLHTWVLLAIPAAFGTWYLLDVVRPRFSFRISMPTLAAPIQQPAASTEPGAPLPVRRVMPSLPVARPRPLRVSGLFISAFAIGAIGLIVAALVYPVFATPQRVRDRFGNETAVRPQTDDGLAYMIGAEYIDQGGPIRLVDDYAAIIWARENIEGSPTIIEGTTPNYRWGSRIAINTGLPAVAGWDFHQLQQRGKFGELVQERQADVTAFYSTSDPEVAQRILEKYSVRYVVIGTLERYYYPEQGIRNLEAGLGGVLRRVYGAGETAIYEVVSDEALVSANP